MTSTVIEASGGSHGWAFGESPLDVAAFGYRQEEFFFDGVATRFGPEPSDERAFDGRWHAEPVESSPFRTRFTVLRPVDREWFNGTVVLSWNNVSGGFEVWGAGADEGAFADGFAYVGVTTQRVGVHGAGENPMGLIAWDPERYGTLSIPSDDYSYDIFTQAARAVGPGRSGTLDPLGGLDVRHVIAQGGSQSAARLATYFNAIQPREGVIDAFILTVYFGRGTPLEVGDLVLTMDSPEIAELVGRGTHLLRPDLGIPVMVVNSESETPSCLPVRQPDTEYSRWWEVAGTVHGSPDTVRDLMKRLGRDLGVELPSIDAACQASTRPVTDAALHHMHRWVNGGPPPPRQPLIETAGEPPHIDRDADGIARGGIRLPHADVPLSGTSSSAGPSASGGPDFGPTYVDFRADELWRRYGDRAHYLVRFERAALAAAAAGVLLEREVEALVVEAAAAFLHATSPVPRQ
jgi:Alpha/beta hydrolase domain